MPPRRERGNPARTGQLPPGTPPSNAPGQSSEGSTPAETSISTTSTPAVQSTSTAPSVTTTSATTAPPVSTINRGTPRVSPSIRQRQIHLARTLNNSPNTSGNVPLQSSSMQPTPPPATPTRPSRFTALLAANTAAAAAAAAAANQTRARSSSVPNLRQPSRFTSLLPPPPLPPSSSSSFTQPQPRPRPQRGNTPRQPSPIRLTLTRPTQEITASTLTTPSAGLPGAEEGEEVRRTRPNSNDHPGMRWIMRNEIPRQPPFAGPTGGFFGARELFSSVSAQAGRKRSRSEDLEDEDKDEEKEEEKDRVGGWNEGQSTAAFGGVGGQSVGGIGPQNQGATPASSSSSSAGPRNTDGRPSITVISTTHSRRGSSLTAQDSSLSTTYSFRLPPGVNPTYPHGFSGQIIVPSSSPTATPLAATPSSASGPSATITAGHTILSSTGPASSTATGPTSSSTAAPSTPGPPPQPTMTTTQPDEDSNSGVGVGERPSMDPREAAARTLVNLASMILQEMRANHSTSALVIETLMNSPATASLHQIPLNTAGGDGSGSSGGTFFTLPNVNLPLPVPIEASRAGGGNVGTAAGGGDGGGNVGPTAGGGNSSPPDGDGDGNGGRGGDGGRQQQPLQQLLLPQEVRLNMRFQAEQRSDQSRHAVLSEIEVEPVVDGQSGSSASSYVTAPSSPPSSISSSSSSKCRHRNKRRRVNVEGALINVTGSIVSGLMWGGVIWMMSSDNGRQFAETVGQMIRLRLQSHFSSLSDQQQPPPQ